jgi:hypothetical protein
MRLSRSATLGRNPLQVDLIPNPNESTALFNGPASPATDGQGLTSQLQRVEAVMADGYWRTISNIAAELRRRHAGCRYAETSISARLRDMRRRGWTIERERTRPGSGLFQYRAVKSEAISC